MMNANALSTALSCHPSTRAGSSTPSAPNSPVIGSGEKVERKNTFVCTFPDCDKSFSKAYSLKTHHISHSNQRPFCCLFCTGKSFARKHDLLRHVRTVHGSKLPQLPQECIYCQAKMNQMEELTEHLYNCAVGPTARLVREAQRNCDQLEIGP
ncbi:hypothetical protein BC829DRAFT_270038 [Chytridium lagenaria]|nr:hypothetical protein BC829DRAFT_270038 [Chytridium lagenaria]